MTFLVRPNLPTAERLKSKKDIEELFKKSSSFFVKPILLKYRVYQGPGTNKLLVVVPKKTFKKASDRNLLKRRLRVAYRLNKGHLSSDKYYLHLAVLYIDEKILPFHQIEEKLISSMERLHQKLS